jgi:hypothetical protein
LQAFGLDWVKRRLVLKERLIEITKVMRRYPWMVEVVRQRPMSILHPYICGGGRVGGVPLVTSSNAFCARNGTVKKTKLELVFSRYETYEEKIREIYRPKGLLAFAAAAREYVRIL